MNTIYAAQVRMASIICAMKIARLERSQGDHRLPGAYRHAKCKDRNSRAANEQLRVASSCCREIASADALTVRRAPMILERMYTAVSRVVIWLRAEVHFAAVISLFIVT